MMKENNISGSLSKVLKLIFVLEKCNGKTAVGDSNALISPKAVKALICGGLLVVTGGLFTAVYLLQPYVASFITLRGLMQALMLLLLIMSFMLAVKDIVIVLYTADDISVLLPMPFSANQIVSAKLAVALRFPLILSLIIMNSVSLAFGIREGAGASFIIGTVLSSVLIPVTGLSAATLLVVVVFRVFGFIRNRDVTMVLSGVFTLALTFAYIFINNRLRRGGSSVAAAEAVTVLSSLALTFPNITFMNRFMLDGSIAGFLISIGITATVVILAMTAVRIFYLSTALSMQNTGTNKKAVTKDALRAKGKSDALKALTVYEEKSTRRNPAYMIYGFAMTFLWPVLMILPIILSNDSFVNTEDFPYSMNVALIIFLFLGITASCFSCGFNILAGSAFSREGRCFYELRAMPLDFRDYYKSKRNFSLLICSLGSIPYVIVFGIVCVAAGAITIGNSWTVLPGACICFLLNLLIINLLLLHNSRKPYFNWDSETEISRKLTWINLAAVIVGVFSMLAALISVMLSSFLDEITADSDFTLFIMAAAALLLVIVFVLAFTINRYAVRKGSANLLKIE